MFNTIENRKSEPRTRERRSPAMSPRRAMVTLAILGLSGWLATGCGSSSRSRRPADPGLASAMANQQTLANQAATQPGAAGTSTSSTEPPAVNDYSYRLAPGDLIDVKFPYHPEENERVPVRPDGEIGLQVTGDIMAAGMTPKQLEQTIAEKAAATLRNPVVSVVVAQLAEHKVYVGGDVQKPGFVMYRDGLTPLQAVIERGGFLDTAKLNSVLYITRNGDQIQTQTLDLKAIVDGKATEQVVMSPDDILFVPRTFIGKADVWVDQWIRGLLPTVPRPGFDLNQTAF